MTQKFLLFLIIITSQSEKSYMKKKYFAAFDYNKFTSNTLHAKINLI